METSILEKMELLHVKQRPITVDEYRVMGRAGIIRHDERVELIDGRVIAMSPIGRTRVQELWIVVVQAKEVEIYRRPRGDDYEEKDVLRPGDDLLCPGGATIAVRDVFPG